MYKAYLDGQPLYIPNNDMVSVIEPVVQLNLDEAGSFSFNIPPTNPLYNKIYKILDTKRNQEGSMKTTGGKQRDELLYDIKWKAFLWNQR